jgi:hypothetical protein
MAIASTINTGKIATLLMWDTSFSRISYGNNATPGSRNNNVNKADYRNPRIPVNCGISE